MNALEVYQRATTDAAAFNCSAFGKLVLRGKDAGSFLQAFTTNDVVKPGPGGGCETFILTAQAKVVAWARVMIGVDEIYLHVDPGLVTRVRQHLEKHLIGEQVTFEDRTEADSLFHVCGPRVMERLQDMGFDVQSLAAWQHVTIAWKGIPCRVQRCDFVAYPGVFVVLPVEAAARFMSLFAEQNVAAASLNDPTWTMLRVEAGTSQGGVDFDETNLPQEVNRTEAAISFTKGCYLGQETVARIRAYGRVNKQLVPVRFPEKTATDVETTAGWFGAVLKVADKEVGRLKTVTYSPRLGCWLAFALVRREHVEVGRRLEAHHAAGEMTAVEVTTWPGRG